MASPAGHRTAIKGLTHLVVASCQRGALFFMERQTTLIPWQTAKVQQGSGRLLQTFNQGIIIQFKYYVSPACVNCPWLSPAPSFQRSNKRGKMCFIVFLTPNRLRVHRLPDLLEAGRGHIAPGLMETQHPVVPFQAAKFDHPAAGACLVANEFFIPYVQQGQIQHVPPVRHQPFVLTVILTQQGHRHTNCWC